VNNSIWVGSVWFDFRRDSPDDVWCVEEKLENGLIVLRGVGGNVWMVTPRYLVRNMKCIQ
jgi:hypothetical protein